MKIKQFLSDSKNWSICYLLVVQADMLMTLAGTHRYGKGMEFNPLIRNALYSGEYLVFIAMSLFTILGVVFVNKAWNLRKPDGTLRKQSIILRLVAWIIVPLYAIIAPLGWIYLFSMGYNPISLELLA